MTATPDTNAAADPWGDDEDADTRTTYLPIRYTPDEEYPWHVKRDDGGPITGSWDSFATEDELLEFLRKFLFRREGVVVIERFSHAAFDVYKCSRRTGWDHCPGTSTCDCDKHQTTTAGETPGREPTGETMSTETTPLDLPTILGNAREAIDVFTSWSKTLASGFRWESPSDDEDLPTFEAREAWIRQHCESIAVALQFLELFVEYSDDMDGRPLREALIRGAAREAIDAAVADGHFVTWVDADGVEKIRESAE